MDTQPPIPKVATDHRLCVFAAFVRANKGNCYTVVEAGKIIRKRNEAITMVRSFFFFSSPFPPAAWRCCE